MSKCHTPCGTFTCDLMIGFVMGYAIAKGAIGDPFSVRIVGSYCELTGHWRFARRQLSALLPRRTPFAIQRENACISGLISFDWRMN
jgi:hypothetical protein